MPKARKWPVKGSRRNIPNDRSVLSASASADHRYGRNHLGAPPKKSGEDVIELLHDFEKAIGSRQFAEAGAILNSIQAIADRCKGADRKTLPPASQNSRIQAEDANYAFERAKARQEA